MSLRLLFVWFPLALALGGGGGAGSARAQAVLDPTQEAPVLDDLLEVLPEADGLPLASVLGAEGFRRGRPLLSPDSVGPQDVWARVTVRSASDRDVRWMIPLAFDDATLYAVGPGGWIDSARTGRSVPLAERSVPVAQPPVVALDLPAGAERTLYVHVHHDAGGYTDEAPLRPVEAERFYASRGARALGQGLFLGLVVALAVYNLFLSVTFRDRSYLYYVLFLAGTAVYWATIEGYVIQFVWPRTLRGYLELNFFALALAAGSYLQFARAYLQTGVLAPRFDRLLAVLIGAWAVAAGLGVASMLGAALWIPAQLLAAGAALLMLVSTFSAGVQAHRRGYAPARYYLLASSPVILTGLGFTVAWLAFPDLAGSARLGFQIGMAAEVLLFSFALSFRIHLLTRERLAALLQKEQAEASGAALQQANAALEEADALKTRLLGVAAHDLRSPLTGILGFAEILRDEAPPASEQEQFAEAISRDAQRMVSLIDDILVTSAIQSHSYTLERAPFDLGALVQEATSRLAARADAKQQRLTLALADDVVVDADRHRVHDVLDNLISNAIKYTPAQGDIAVRLEGDGGEARISVSDTGPGLSPEEQGQLFEPFQKLSPKPTGGESSTGLGLSIVAQIIALHGGRVGVESAPGLGSTFWVTLPLSTPTRDGREAEPLPRRRLEPVGVA